MNKPVAILGALLAITGCGTATTGESDPYSTAADEVERLAAALEEEMTDEAADEAVSDDMMEAVEETARRGRRGRGHFRGGHGGRSHLLRWFGDVEALEACREQRDACDPADDTCREAVKACVETAIEDAFAAMCDEATTLCEGEDAEARACHRIEAACSGDFSSGRDQHAHPGGGFDGFERPDGGLGGHDGDHDRERARDWDRDRDRDEAPAADAGMDG